MMPTESSDMYEDAPMTRAEVLQIVERCEAAAGRAEQAEQDARAPMRRLGLEPALWAARNPRRSVPGGPWWPMVALVGIAAVRSKMAFGALWRGGRSGRQPLVGRAWVSASLVVPRLKTVSFKTSDLFRLD